MRVKVSGGRVTCLCLCFVIAVVGPWRVPLSAAQEAPQATDSAATRQSQELVLTQPSEYFEAIYRDFYNNYRLGRGDEIAIRVVGQPDYSVEHIKVSSIGRIYHPLVGDTIVAGLTVDELTQKLTSNFKEYLVDPNVSVQLVEAQGAKIGVLGEVSRPGIVVMAEPMTVLNAITAVGGVLDSGKKSEVTLLRQSNDGHLRTVTVNLQRILDGKASADENLTLRAGDTVIVHSNLRKKISNITGLPLFSQFVTFLTYRDRN